jgi:hypothetical protein
MAAEAPGRFQFVHSAAGRKLQIELGRIPMTDREVQTI